MKTTILASATLALTAGISVAQPVVVDARMGGYAYNSPYNRLYNSRTQVIFTGKVTGVQRTVPRNGMSEGVTLLVKSANGGTSIVELGPTWFVDRQETKIGLKDNVQVVGSKVMVDGRGVILAKLVKKGLGVLALRRPAGRPYWDINMPIADLGPDPNVVEITGVVDRMTSIGSDANLASGVVLRTDNGYLTIDLGPRWFVQPQGFAFQPGSNLTVLTRGTYNLDIGGRPIPAYYLFYDNGYYQFRNPVNGMGIWQGWAPNP